MLVTAAVHNGEGTTWRVPDFLLCFHGSTGSLLDPDSRRCIKFVAREERSGSSEATKHAHTHTHADTNVIGRQRDVGKSKRNVRSHSPPNLLPIFLPLLLQSRDRSSLQWRHAARLCSREQQQACRGRAGRRGRGRREGEREGGEEQMQKCESLRKKKPFCPQDREKILYQLRLWRWKLIRHHIHPAQQLTITNWKDSFVLPAACLPIN